MSKPRSSVSAEHSVGEAKPAGALAALGQQLGELQDVLTALVQLTEEKLAALRVADADGLEHCAQREVALVKRVLWAEQQRAALLARVAQSLRLADGQPVTLTEIAAVLPEPLASTLRAKGAALRALAEKLQKKNRIVADVAQKLQTHIRVIFAEAAKATQESLSYGAGGRMESSNTRNWVDAVG